MDINDIIKDGNHIDLMNHAFTHPCPNMNCSCSTSKEREEIVKSFKTKNSYGYDEISPIDFKSVLTIYKLTNKLYMQQFQEADNSPLPTRGSIHPLPRTSSWCSAKLVKHKGDSTFTSAWFISTEYLQKVPRI
jgi:hypothetical protein